MGDPLPHGVPPTVAQVRDDLRETLSRLLAAADRADEVGAPDGAPVDVTVPRSAPDEPAARKVGLPLNAGDLRQMRRDAAALDAALAAVDATLRTAVGRLDPEGPLAPDDSHHGNCRFCLDDCALGLEAVESLLPADANRFEDGR